MISIYCDGSSCASSSKPGGWAFVIVRKDQPLLANSGSDPSTSNNRMELTAAIEGLRALIARKWHLTGELVELVSDSMYTLGIAAGTSSPTKNIDLATLIRQLAIETSISCRWVKGHSSDMWNERCDSLARDAKHTLMPGKGLRKKAKKALKKKAKENPRSALESVSGGFKSS